MELGGNIVLEGFDSRDFTELIVVKKIVGQYARRINDTIGEVEKLHVTLETDDKKLTVSVRLTMKGEDYTSETTKENLYMALDDSLKAIVGKVS